MVEKNSQLTRIDATDEIVGAGIAANIVRRAFPENTPAVDDVEFTIEPRGKVLALFVKRRESEEVAVGNTPEVRPFIMDFKRQILSVGQPDTNLRVQVPVDAQQVGALERLYKQVKPAPETFGGKVLAFLGKAWEVMTQPNPPKIFGGREGFRALMKEFDEFHTRTRDSVPGPSLHLGVYLLDRFEEFLRTSKNKKYQKILQDEDAIWFMKEHFGLLQGD